VYIAAPALRTHALKSSTALQRLVEQAQAAVAARRGPPRALTPLVGELLPTLLAAPSPPRLGDPPAPFSIVHTLLDLRADSRWTVTLSAAVQTVALAVASVEVPSARAFCVVAMDMMLVPATVPVPTTAEEARAALAAAQGRGNPVSSTIATIASGIEVAATDTLWLSLAADVLTPSVTGVVSRGRFRAVCYTQLDTDLGTTTVLQASLRASTTLTASAAPAAL
jgi:hypothetical protein